MENAHMQPRFDIEISELFSEYISLCLFHKSDLNHMV